MIAWVAALGSRIAAVFGARRLDSEFADELQEHLRSLADDYVKAGMTPAAAERAARLRLGGIAQLEEQQRERRGLPWLESAWQDLRYTRRSLTKHPGFALVAVLTLGVGIGATTAMFSVARAVLMRPLPFQDPGRLVRVFETNPLKGWTRTVAAPANLTDWQKENTTFTEIASYNGANADSRSQFDVILQRGDAPPQPLKGLSVSANLFRVLGVQPFLGRTFVDEEMFDGKAQVAILSYGLWQRVFNGDPAVIGRKLGLSGRQYEIVGVMGADFAFPGRDVQLWVPFGYPPSLFTQVRRAHMLNVVGRLRPGVSFEQARTDMTAIAARLERTYPDTNTQMGIRLEPFHESLTYDVRSPTLLLMSMVGVLFLIVCVNMAGLQIGRGATRARELTIRHAIGASRGRIVRQLITESLALSLLGGLVGLVVADAARWLLARTSGDLLPVYADVRMDRMVLGFAVGLVVLAPMLFGVVPALRSARPGALRDRSDGAGPGSMRHVLVACEVALSVVLIVTAGLLFRSLVLLERVDPGFRADHAVAFKVTFQRNRYDTDPQLLSAIEDAERRFQAMPGVDALGSTSSLALKSVSWTGDTTVEGRRPDDFERETRHASVSPGYFRALGTALVRGRLVDEHDRPQTTAVTLVNETLARQYFRGADAVGRRISFGRPTDKTVWVTIVGVVKDVQQDGLDAAVRPEVYVPMAQDPQNTVMFVARSQGDIADLMVSARRELRAVDNDLAITDGISLDQLLNESTRDQRFRTILLLVFAGLALLLASLGVYGVLAFLVSRRAREMGVRLALGASARGLFAMVVGQGMRWVLAGLVIGLGIAYAGGRAISSQLFGVTPSDPATFLVSAAVLLVVATCACALPAWRAAHVDPMAILRND